MIEAIGRVQGVIADVDLDDFEANWEKRWLVERGLEIVSEASRRLSEALKARHPDIPWTKVAGIGNILRHDYHHVAADVLWKLVHHDLSALEVAARTELSAALSADRQEPPAT